MQVNTYGRTKLPPSAGFIIKVFLNVFLFCYKPLKFLISRAYRGRFVEIEFIVA